jgi:tripeptidyl-peptidase I
LREIGLSLTLSASFSSFPGTCPYVTSVGATQLPAGKSVTDPECATYEVIYSGGGASNNFPIPSYQKSAVANYYSKHAPPYTAAQYNNSQQVRMFPDVSANGARYALPIEGQYYHLYGTSASSPTFGSIVTLLNGARIAIGKSPLGFLNPWLYQNPWILTGEHAFCVTADATPDLPLLLDITNGTNPGCGTQGFSAVPGWDPVTVSGVRVC